VELPVFELSFIEQSWLARPLIVALAIELAVFKLAFIVVAILHLENASPVEDVS